MYCSALLWHGVITVAGNPSEFCVLVNFLKQVFLKKKLQKMKVKMSNRGKRSVRLLKF